MGLDGGYIGSLDHAIANLHIGRQQGREQGFQEGYQQGVQEGHQQGYESGWNAGVEAGNKQILRQMEYTREHVAGRETLQAQVVEQIDLNARLHARVKQLEQENAEMMSAAKQVVAEDKALIQQLQQQLAISEAEACERASRAICQSALAVQSLLDRTERGARCSRRAYRGCFPSCRPCTATVCGKICSAGQQSAGVRRHQAPSGRR